ncbi:acetamidase/formamidase family protein [Aspergillus steynii IBT 23096]|uniref:Acetamidase/formamidase family protein n=1 Tax=Aspergillus steynii IBT 23096 TaxID=1392250 RepID=A0A2I2FY47_9EURO|nr:acetamidase/formamidase family protein [Aspergillus steynii IBT 23096]PLB45554.1 acetamidase/formamidase family protein [Aspergillus steynii IBT 23096]
MTPAGHIGRNHAHLRWSKNLAPAQTITSGETITFDAIDSSNGQITPDSDVRALSAFDISIANPVFGPVFIEDAQPGDALKVEILALETASWGWSAVIPNFGLLSSDFPHASLRIWHLDRTTQTATLPDNDRVRVPLRPFLGCMGLAPASDADLSVIPPNPAGGNIDCCDLTIGSVVYLPVQTAGALFSCGDGHAVQGHGEVCGTAIETPIKATLRFEVCKGQAWVKTPHYEIPASVSVSAGNAALSQSGRYAATGLGSDLVEASKEAVRSVIEWMVATRGLSRVDAYMLASVVGNLQIVEAVNMPKYLVSMAIPLGVFIDA